METRELTLAAVIAALYAALVIFLAPISFGPIQLRMADALIPLSALMGLPAVVGVSLGALIGNAYFMAYTGLIDVVFGAVPACLAGSLVIGVIVGGYLWIYFPPPPIGGLVMPAWLGMVVSITLSSVIAVTVLGVLLVKALEASGFVETLKGRGL
jgi:hypothetical protein